MSNCSVHEAAANDSADLAPGISVVVPVYNSADSLHLLVQRLTAALEPQGGALEIILVDDRSRDRSWQVIEQLAAEDARIRGLRMMRNYGQHNALLCGIRAARHATTVTLDDDLQHPPEEIPTLLERLQPGVDLVYGVPNKEQHGLWRDAASVITKWGLQSALGTATAMSVSSFRVFRTRLRTAFETYDSPNVLLDVLLTWGTSSVAAVKVHHATRTIGVSNYNFSKLVTHALNMITGFSVLPLRVASLLGLVLTFFGLAVLMYVLIRYFAHGSTVAGFTFIASLVSIFSGAQMLALGIIGEYLARMHLRIMRRPTYVVGEIARGVQISSEASSEKA